MKKVVLKIIYNNTLVNEFTSITENKVIIKTFLTGLFDKNIMFKNNSVHSFLKKNNNKEAKWILKNKKGMVLKISDYVPNVLYLEYSRVRSIKDIKEQVRPLQNKNALNMHFVLSLGENGKNRFFVLYDKIKDLVKARDENKQKKKKVVDIRTKKKEKSNDQVKKEVIFCQFKQVEAVLKLAASVLYIVYTEVNI